MGKMIDDRVVVSGNPLDIPVLEQTEQQCLVDAFVRKQREHERGQPLFISCPCKKCTPYSLG